MKKAELKNQIIEKSLKIRPVTKGHIDFARKMAAKYIFIHDKDGKCQCQACEKESVLKGTKHLGKAKCPECGREMTVVHTWRYKNPMKTEVIKWTCAPVAIDGKTVVLRYILAHSNGTKMLSIKESARFIVHEDLREPLYMDYYQGEWKNLGRRGYFRADTWICPNRFMCWDAVEYPRTFFRELNKLDCFKYYPAENVYMINHYPSQIHFLVRSARLNEKLAKAGLKELAENHYNYYTNHCDTAYGNIDNKQTSLIKMLKLDAKRFALLKDHQHFDFLQFLQSQKNLDYKLLEYAEYSTSFYNEAMGIISRTGITSGKVMKYAANAGKKTNRTNIYEWSHYLDTCEKLGYDIHDTYYSMPKDFRKADDLVTKRWDKIQDEKRRAEAEARDRKVNKKIRLIKEGLMKLPELQELLQGSRGFLVHVPETAEELRQEGNKLHNCIGQYVDRVADGKTLLFFIRRLDDATAPFVAMEYCHGQVIQCRYDNNRAVEEDCEIYDFAQKIAEIMKKNNILVA